MGAAARIRASEWRDRIKTLQRQAMRREDVPTRLKDAIGELWQMGRTYARGNARKAAELRRRDRGCVGRVKCLPTTFRLLYPVVRRDSSVPRFAGIVFNLQHQPDM